MSASTLALHARGWKSEVFPIVGVRKTSEGGFAISISVDGVRQDISTGVESVAEKIMNSKEKFSGEVRFLTRKEGRL